MLKQRPASRLLALGAMVAMLGTQPTLACTVSCLLGGHARRPSLAHSAPPVQHDTDSGTPASHAAGHHRSESTACHGASLVAPTVAAIMVPGAALVPHPPTQQWALLIYVVRLERTPLDPSDVPYSNDPPPPRSV